jgi:F0F1-type ATP synthase membrane subunit b/b'
LKVIHLFCLQNLNERKRKAADERQKIEEETEELKAGFEAEINSLREKLRKQRTNTDVETADKVQFALLKKKIKKKGGGI